MSTLNIHIIGVGYKPEPILKIIRSDMPCDRIHLLWNEETKITEAKEKIVSTLKEMGFDDDNLITNKVDAFDYQDILNKIMVICQQEKIKADDSDNKVRFFFNMTHGTRLMTGAMSTASLLIGGQLYYLKEEKERESVSINDLIIKIPAPKIPSLDSLTEERRRFLKKVCENKNGLTVSDLAIDFKSKQNVNQFVGFFEENNLVERRREGRNTRIVATEIGMMAVQWLI